MDKKERHSLGAHFTPRAYVERLVRPTLEEPVREDWDATQARIRDLASSNKIKDAKGEARAFMKRLSEIRVLDPACGSGNFLYVSLDLLKAIEDEAFALLLALEGGQTELCLDASEVTPKQFIGIEINPRAKAITELVLWIGYLQWHFRSKHRGGKPREPVLEDYRNIECRDAVLSYDSQDLRRDAVTGKPVTRWDGATMKKSRITGGDVPDDAARLPIFTYPNARKAAWPSADFIVGNPPFIGNWRMRAELGDGYTEALRVTYDDVPESSEFVMYWWDRAARLVRDNSVRRAGFITTTSITQTFNRRVVQTHMEAENPVRLIFAIADHPWTTAKYDQADGGAEVRTAMTVIVSGTGEGRCGRIVREQEAQDGEVRVDLAWSTGTINADLTVGADVAGAGPLRANSGLSCPGVKLHGAGFIVTRAEASSLGLGREPGLEQHLRPYVNGQDLAALSRDALVIDLLGLSADDTRSRYPAIYQRVSETVRPEREQNARETYRKNWWLFGEPRRNFRPALAGLKRYIATPESARRRYFVFLDGDVLPDNMVIAIALDDAYFLGVLSSRIHSCWALAAGGRLGIRHDPRYNKTRCFEPFPFPEAAIETRARIRALGEQIDTHRKRQQTLHPKLTLTKLYKALDAARAGEELDAADRTIWEQGLGSTLLSLHADVDAAVFEAYGWPDTLTDGQVLDRLVALNAQRAAEEREHVRWLRPEFQQAIGADVEPAEIESTDDDRPGIAKSKPPKGPGIAATRTEAGKRKSKRAAH